MNADQIEGPLAAWMITLTARKEARWQYFYLTLYLGQCVTINPQLEEQYTSQYLAADAIPPCWPSGYYHSPAFPALGPELCLQGRVEPFGSGLPLVTKRNNHLKSVLTANWKG